MRVWEGGHQTGLEARATGPTARHLRTSERAERNEIPQECDWISSRRQALLCVRTLLFRPGWLRLATCPRGGRRRLAGRWRQEAAAACELLLAGGGVWAVAELELQA